jgi:predicted dehydrogenase
MISTNIPVRLGIIGVGQIGKRHIERYSEIDSAEIVAVADIDEAEAQAVSMRHAIPHRYADVRQLLARDDIDAVDVCLHNNLHRTATVAALEAGKHVFCEKPMAGSFRDAQSMQQTAAECDRMLSIQLNSLFSGNTKAAKELINRGQLGRIYHARSTGYRRRGRPYVDGYGSHRFVQKRTASGGALYDMGVYNIAQMLYLIGNPPVETVTGQIYQETAIDPQRRRESGYDVEELALGFVRFTGNVTLDLIEAWAAHMDAFEGSSIFGSEGGVRLEPFGYFRSVGDLDLNASADLEAMAWRMQQLGRDGDAFDSPQKHWIAALQGRVELLPTAELALSTMLISEGIYLSHKLGREVSAAEIRELSRSNALPL